MRLPALLPFIMILCSASTPDSTQVYIRVNQAGYFPADTKIAIVFSDRSIKGNFNLLDVRTMKTVYRSSLKPSETSGWSNFSHYYRIDFTPLQEPGQYRIIIPSTGDTSSTFSIGKDIYNNHPDIMLQFMRQQRCGYNPFLDMVCHQKDGKTMYGPMPDSTYIDVSGGWHDAGDQLKYLITSSNATARMLMAWEKSPGIFPDHVNALGQAYTNGIPDILDEAKWGLDWIHKMHPAPDQLFHQVADDRDHIGWKWPDKDNSDYGWGPETYRVVYFANGKPQGLKKYKSEATGIANLAGRCAAAMALAYRIWKDDLQDPIYAEQCLKAATELYDLGREHEGYQQGNSYGAPYRYTEDTWTDDMELGAVELYKATGNQKYLDDALYYALMTGNTSWMKLDSAKHYQFYPFVNVAHSLLYPYANEDLKTKLIQFYRDGINKILARSESNIYQVGIPFLWCSNNLMVAFITQVLLYEDMTGDLQFHQLMLAHRDWLYGRNPWGTTMFTGIPDQGEYPEDVHTSVWYLTKRMVSGGLVDGPVYASIYNNLIGITLTDKDEFSLFQNNYVVYHDDIGDYSTNEPTMDGTADAIFMGALLCK